MAPWKPDRRETERPFEPPQNLSGLGPCAPHKINPVRLRTGIEKINIEKINKNKIGSFAHFFYICQPAQ